MQVEPATCPVCRLPYDPLRARATLVVDGRVRAFCSPVCKERSLKPEPVSAPIVLPAVRPAARSRPTAAAALIALVVGGGGMMIGSRLFEHAPSAAARIARPTVAVASKPPEKPRPTPEEALALITKQSAENERDIWVHPLYGPERVLPARSSRRFGAPREGMRPEECREGHCGVDLGTRKGETVIAAHDGVVERVQRDADEGGRRGNEGRFVRINHKGGTVVTSYIHLDTIRNDLKPGIPVKAGEPIGTVGDTGVQRSGPHLHFAVSVRPAYEEPELFIDPEPLLHLWPLRDRPDPSELPPRARKLAAASTPTAPDVR